VVLCGKEIGFSRFALARSEMVEKGTYIYFFDLFERVQEVPINCASELSKLYRLAARGSQIRYPKFFINISEMV